MKGLGGKAKAKEILTTTEDGRIMKTTQKAKGKLTDASIDMLQYYFGLAHVVVQSMNCKMLCFSVFFTLHRPATKDSWCQYQKDINITNLCRPGN